jgi:predicted aldo/keto reductase-like oxidoreductase
MTHRREWRIKGIIRAAYESGLNYFDTAEEYPGHHRVLAKVIKDMDRKKVFIATKLEATKGETKEGFLKRARKALEELQTEYIDCLMMHCPEKAETLADIPGVRADVCRDCGAPCEAACPYGVPVQGMLLVAHDTLSMP